MIRNKYDICNIKTINDILNASCNDLKWYSLKSGYKVVTIGKYANKSLCLIKKTANDPFMVGFQYKDNIETIPVEVFNEIELIQFISQGVFNNLSRRIEGLHNRENKLLEVFKTVLAV